MLTRFRRSVRVVQNSLRTTYHVAAVRMQSNEPAVRPEGVPSPPCHFAIKRIPLWNDQSPVSSVAFSSCLWQPSFKHGDQERAIAASLDGSKSTVIFTIEDSRGALKRILDLFDRYDINLSHIRSHPTKGAESHYEFVVDFAGAAPQQLLEELRRLSVRATEGKPVRVPWFPMKVSDIDAFSKKTLDAGAELESDHPGFSDMEYRARREFLVMNASTYRYGEEIPRVQYTDQETEVWGTVYRKVKEYSHFAVDQFKEILPEMEKHCGYAEDNIPQLEDVSQYLKRTTGFSLRPVAGLLSARDFLNALAFRVFFSTQYIRHHSTPLYTPEPDICHELLGHAPMFVDPDFADFSQEIGLASLGATDDDIKKLATCYWFSVEFGICQQRGEKKAYGAGLLSSFGELEYSCAPYRPAGGVDHYPEYRPWDPKQAAAQEYPITTYQPVYFVAESFQDAKEKMRDYCQHLQRPFGVRYDPKTESVTVDRAVERGEYTVTLQS